MDITLLIESIVGLISILGILMLFLLWSSKEKQKKSTEPQPADEAPKQDTSLEALRMITHRQNATTQELANVVELLLKYHPTIHAKLGVRTHPEFDIYADILFHLGRHKQITKKILLRFSNELEKQNPNYKKEIEDALMRGLNSRGL